MKKSTTEKMWLDLLRDALDNNVKIAMNHKYEYKGKRLGSFLVHAKKRKNKELYNKIEELGFIYKYHSKKPRDVMEAYIHRLWNDPAPKKDRYITRFNMFILPKKHILEDEQKEELNVVWKMKFGDKRRWTKRPGSRQRVNLWKKFRYDIDLNPEEQWYIGPTRMKGLYYWVRARKLSKTKMDKIAKYFNDTEILELVKEGFPIDSSFIKKPRHRRITKQEKAKKIDGN